MGTAVVGRGGSRCLEIGLYGDCFECLPQRC